MSHMVQRSAAAERAPARGSREAGPWQTRIRRRHSAAGRSSAWPGARWEQVCSRPAATTTGRRDGSSTSGGSLRLSQWYHQYGEDGTQQAVEGYAKAYPGASVTVQWNPGDYDQKVASALLTDGGPDIFEFGNGPSIDMIQGGQVVDMSGILGDAASDFTRSLVQRMTYKGKLYAVPQVTDMQLLVYRKSLLQAAGVNAADDRRRAHRRRQDADDRQGQGPLRGQRRRRRRARRSDALGGRPGLPQRRPDPDGLRRQPRRGGARPAAHPVHQRRPAARRAGRLVRPVGVHPGARARCSGRVCGRSRRSRRRSPATTACMAWPALDAQGKPSVPVGAYGSCVSAKTHNVDAAKGFVKWLWVDQTAKQLDFAQSFGFHIPARQSVAAQGRQAEEPARLGCGQAGQRERPRADAAAVDAEVRDGVLRRTDPHRQGRRRPQGRDRHDEDHRRRRAQARQRLTLPS